MITSVLLVASLSNWAVIEAYHHGSIFERFRAWVEAHDGFFAELLSCPYCLSHWTALPLTVLSMLALCDLTWNNLALLPVLVFAVTRLSNLWNDLGRPICRTPNRHDVSQELGELARIAEGKNGTGETEKQI